MRENSWTIIVEIVEKGYIRDVILLSKHVEERQTEHINQPIKSWFSTAVSGIYK